MSTEKSLSTDNVSINWSEWRNMLNTVGTTLGKIIIPLGVMDGTMQYSELKDDDSNQHMCVVGLTGSGKGTYVTFLIKALEQMYGQDIIFHYIDGKNCELRQWLRDDGSTRFNRGKFVGATVDYESFVKFMNEFAEYLDEDTSVIPHEVLILDDVDYIVQAMSEKNIKLFSRIIEEAPKHGVHIIYCSQQFWEQRTIIDRLGGMNNWQIVSATRVQSSASMRLFGSTVAADSVRRYGDLVVKSNEKIIKVAVPFISYRELKEI